MNTSPNLEITDEETEVRQKTYWVSRKNQRIPWPNNSAIVEFVTGGNYRKFRFLTTGDPNVKIVQVK